MPEDLAEPFQRFVGPLFAISFKGTTEKRETEQRRGYPWFGRDERERGRDAYHLGRHIRTGGDAPEKLKNNILDPRVLPVYWWPTPIGSFNHLEQGRVQPLRIVCMRALHACISCLATPATATTRRVRANNVTVLGFPRFCSLSSLDMIHTGQLRHPVFFLTVPPSHVITHQT